MRRILSSRDATVMIWMFPVFTTSCSVTLAFSCFKGRLDNTVLAGKLTRMRPSAAVVEDSVGSTSVSPFRNVLVSRSSPVTSNFTSFCNFALLEPVATSEASQTCKSKHIERLRLCLWSVRLQASSPLVPSEETSSVEALNDGHAMSAFVVDSKHQVLSQSQTRSCSR